ncbi:MAG TPA: hypothetical protein VFG53_08865 [Anaeromyxobacter sp.]|nr:hypothetical protein [Anaeromyxobacter sp.]
MNRLLALFAASTVVTGCYVSSPTCNTHNVAIGWPSFVMATSTGYITTNQCTIAIAGMNVYVDGGGALSAACTDNALIVTLPTGSHSAIVEAVDSGNYPILRDQVQFNVNTSCADQFVATQPGEGVFTLDYHFSPDVCNTSGVGGVSFIWYSILDQTIPPPYVITAVDENSTNKEVYQCGGPVQFTLPAGSYGLIGAEEVVRTLTPGTYAVTGAYCPSPPQGFQVQSGVDAVLTVTLPDTNSGCL